MNNAARTTIVGILMLVSTLTILTVLEGKLNAHGSGLVFGTLALGSSAVVIVIGVISCLYYILNPKEQLDRLTGFAALTGVLVILALFNYSWIISFILNLTSD